MMKREVDGRMLYTPELDGTAIYNDGYNDGYNFGYNDAEAACGLKHYVVRVPGNDTGVLSLPNLQFKPDIVTIQAEEYIKARLHSGALLAATMNMTFGYDKTDNGTASRTVTCGCIYANHIAEGKCGSGYSQLGTEKIGEKFSYDDVSKTGTLKNFTYAVTGVQGSLSAIFPKGEKTESADNEVYYIVICVKLPEA